MADLTPTDVMAMNNRDGFGDSAWWIILILFFVFGGFGNNNQTNTNDEFIKRDIFNTNSNVSATASETQNQILNSKYDTSMQVLENRYANQLANANLQKDVLLGNANLQATMSNNALSQSASMAQCCCELKTAIHSEGEETRALISQLDRENLQYQLNQANTAVSNAVQTQNILNSLGRFYTNPPVNPYSAYTYGTTIT